MLLLRKDRGKRSEIPVLVYPLNGSLGKVLSPSSALFRRAIRRFDIIALIINSTIRAGILGLPAKVYALVKTWNLLAYSVSAIVVTLSILR